MMRENNNMVAPLATPTRFLIESGEWNLTPTNFINQEVNAFDCNFQGQQQPTNNKDKWSSSLLSSQQTMYITETSEEINNNNNSSPTPTMSLSQSPSSTSASFSTSTLDNNTLSPPPPNTTTMLYHHDNTQCIYPQPRQLQPIQQVEMNNTRRTSLRRNNNNKQQGLLSDYLQDEEEEELVEQQQQDRVKLKLTASGQSGGGRKRRIVFEGKDTEDRRKKFLERNRVAAYKCRQKKKNRVQELEQNADFQNTQNDQLRQLVCQLKQESMYLRNLLLSHGNCDCDSVQVYLRKSSAEIICASPPPTTSRRTSFDPPMFHGASFSSFPESTNTGLTPFLNTAIHKTSAEQQSATAAAVVVVDNNSSSGDYFFHSHSSIA